MKGVGVTLLQLLWGNGMQRGLASVGLALTLLGIGALDGHWHPEAEPLFAAAAIGGIAATVAYPIVIDALLFRCLSAPRAMQLIPRGRAKVLLGALCSQLLLALFLSVTVSALLAVQIGGEHSLAMGPVAGLMVRTFVIAFTGVSAFFLSFFWGLQFPLRLGLWMPFIILPGLLSSALPSAHLRALIVAPSGLVTLGALTSLAWLMLAVTYLRARQILEPQWKFTGTTASGTGASAEFTRRQAIRILLWGSISRRSVKIWSAVLLSAAFIFILVLDAHMKGIGRFALMWAFLICFYGSLIPGIVVASLSRRTRFLWLTAGLGRAELFAMVESQGWRLIRWAAVICVVLAEPLLAISARYNSASLRNLSILAMPLATSAVSVYLSLMTVRGKRFTDSLTWLAFVALVLIDFFSAAIESLRAALPVILAAQILAIPLLRAVARSRWHSIDWLLHRPLDLGFTARINS